MKKKFIFGTLGGLCILLLGFMYFLKEKSTEGQAFAITTSEAFSTVENESEELFCVFVCGQVTNPGIYYLTSGSRVYDAIEAAGGILENGQINSINQAELIVDCEKIYIPAYNEMSPQTSDINTGLININHAGISELTSLPGIGEARAKSIIEYRETKGCFLSIEDIKKVTGIKDSAFEKIKEYICV